MHKESKGLLLPPNQIAKGKTKQDMARLIQALVNVRTELNQDPETQTKISNLEERQQRLQLAQRRRTHALMDRNYKIYTTEGERMSRYHLQRSSRGKASSDISKLVIQEPQGDRVIEGAEIPDYMFKKHEKICNPGPVKT